MVFQGYDGASVMSGCVSGVQSHIRELVPNAIYIHCHAHCLNLVLVDCVTSASDFFHPPISLHLLSASNAHELFIQQQAEVHPKKQPRELQRLSETRWACRYLSLDSVFSTFDAIIFTLQLIGDGRLEGMTKQSCWTTPSYLQF